MFRRTVTLDSEQQEKVRSRTTEFAPNVGKICHCKMLAFVRKPMKKMVL
jgi:hypothetical protein